MAKKKGKIRSSQSSSVSPASVSEAAIVAVCWAGNFGKLQRWARQGGVRVTSYEPLYAAVFGGFLEIVKCLVKEFGADVNQADHDGNTALIVAAEKGNMDIVRCLVKEFGAVVNQAATDGYTALIAAVWHDHLAVVRCLIKEFGADVNQALNDGATPVCVAAQQGHLAVLRCV
jgi:ankyrin repeat protein